MKIVVCLVVIASCFALTARLPTANAQPAPDQKSYDIAVGLSLGGTLLGAGLLYAAASRSGSASGQPALLGASALAMVTGPSFGRWYAGEASLPTIGVRALAVGTTAFLLGAVGDEEPPAGLFWPALAVVAGTTIYDIYKAKSGTDAYNARQRKAANKVTYTTRPVVAPTTKGAATGLAIQGRF